MHITFVKKILADGEPCAKCADVERRLHRSGQMTRIDRVIIADERDPASEGMRLADLHGVDTAPFFIVERDSGTVIYTVYLKFARDVFASDSRPVDEAREALRANPDLGLI
ncbi:MAG: hypothetical protein F4X98_08135 [Gammaproteobacteria bacterium]|nr:hypothetical protein [Gammaproteobacteria bacterium]